MAPSQLELSIRELHVRNPTRLREVIYRVMVAETPEGPRETTTQSDKKAGRKAAGTILDPEDLTEGPDEYMPKSDPKAAVKHLLSFAKRRDDIVDRATRG